MNVTALGGISIRASLNDSANTGAKAIVGSNGSDSGVSVSIIGGTASDATAEMNGLDVLVFTAGIGENQCNLRELVCKDMDWCGIAIDTEKNQVRGEEVNISAPGARVQTWVAPTEEEYMIALDTMRIAQEQK